MVKESHSMMSVRALNFRTPWRLIVNTNIRLVLVVIALLSGIIALLGVTDAIATAPLPFIILGGVLLSVPLILDEG